MAYHYCSRMERAAAPRGSRSGSLSETAAAAASPPATGSAFPGSRSDSATHSARSLRTLLGGLDTMRFTTELLPPLAGQPGIAVEVTGEPAGYREAGDTLRIGLSADEVAGDTDWFDLGVTVTVAGQQVPFTDVFVALSAASRICCSPMAPTSPCRNPSLSSFVT
jgi:hypothetical protein